MSRKELIKKVTALYSDKDGFKELMEDLENYEYWDCAKKVMTKEFGENKELAIEFYKKAEEECDNYYCLINLAESIIKNLNDKEFAKEIYKQAEREVLQNLEDLEYNDDLEELVKSIIENLNDKEFVKEIYERKARKKCKNIDHFIRLIESFLKNFDDKEFVKELYRKAEEKCEYIEDFKELAESIMKNLNDKELAKELYRKAGNKCKSIEDFKELAESIIKNLNDKELAEEFKKQAKEIAEEFIEYYIELDQSCGEYTENSASFRIRVRKNTYTFDELQKMMWDSFEDIRLTDSCIKDIIEDYIIDDDGNTELLEVHESEDEYDYDVDCGEVYVDMNLVK